jgi:hypothetical protein
MKLKEVDTKSPQVSFCLFSQNENEEGFVGRIANEPLEATIVYLDRYDKVLEKEEDGCKVGVRLQVKVAEKPAPVKKKATAKAAE